MDLDLAHNVLTERDPNVASRTVDIPKQGKQTQDDMTEDTRTDLAEESTSMTSPTIKYWLKEEREPKRQKQEIKTTPDKIAKEAQDLLDLFQAPQGMVSITIPSGKKFALHIDVLADKCDYFRAALTGNFRETHTKVLNLPDVSDNTFGFFLKWIYSGNLKPEYDPKRCNMHNESSLTVPDLFNLWFFADYLRAPALQNNVIINVVEKFRSFMMWSTEERFQHLIDSIKVLWKTKGRTDRGELAKPLRDLFLDFVANPDYMPKAKSQKLLKSAPASFLREFALTTVDRNYTIDTKTCAATELLAPPEDYDSDIDESERFEDELESVFVKLDTAMDIFKQFQCVWDIKPEKYFVKDAKKAQESE